MTTVFVMGKKNHCVMRLCCFVFVCVCYETCCCGECHNQFKIETVPVPISPSHFLQNPSVLFKIFCQIVNMLSVKSVKLKVVYRR